MTPAISPKRLVILPRYIHPSQLNNLHTIYASRKAKNEGRGNVGRLPIFSIAWIVYRLGYRGKKEGKGRGRHKVVCTAKPRKRKYGQGEKKEDGLALAISPTCLVIQDQCKLQCQIGGRWERGEGGRIPYGAYGTQLAICPTHALP